MINWLNKIPKDWAVEDFRNVAELRHGYQFRNYDFTEEGIKIFKITQIKGDGISDISSCSYIDANRIDEFERVLLKRGDILIALTGATIGKVARFNYDELVLQNYRVGNFFPLDETILLKEYFYQFLKSDFFFNQIIANQTQSAQQNIGKEDINNMSVILPPIEEQTAIASILSTIDAKIENNLAINKTLEEMAMALYKEWFVDFGPFQDGKFVDSELGMIPEGWEVKPFLNLFKLLSGGTPKTKISEYWNGDIDWVSAKDIGNQGGSYIVSTEKKITEIGLNNSATKILPEDTVIVVARGSVGKYGIIASPMAMNQSCYGIYSKSSFSQGITYLVVQSLINHFLNVAYGSVFDTITTSTFKSIEILVPPPKTMEEVKDKIDPLFEKIKRNYRENQTLTTLRDTLLPKLISGEVRLNEFANR